MKRYLRYVGVALVFVVACAYLYFRQAAIVGAQQASPPSSGTTKKCSDPTSSDVEREVRLRELIDEMTRYGDQNGARTSEAAVCYFNLREYVEALDLYEKLPAHLIDQQLMTQFQKQVGEIHVLEQTTSNAIPSPSSISVDGRRCNGKVRVPRGQRCVEVRKLSIDPQGFYRTCIDVAGGMKAPVKIIVPLLLGTVTFTSAPPGRRVILDGAHVGDTNVTLRVAPGLHELQLPNGKPATINVPVGTAPVYNLGP